LGTSGGSVEGIKVAAQLGAVGLNPLEFLYTKDSIKRALMIKLAELMVKEKQRYDHNLAVEIANAVGKAFGG
jgi:hypothetical protein